MDPLINLSNFFTGKWKLTCHILLFPDVLRSINYDYPTRHLWGGIQYCDRYFRQ